MKRICALTMVRNDEFYLRKWVEYYGAQLGRENLYVYFDGVDQQVPEWCEGVNVCVREKVVGQVAKADKGRINFLSERAAELLGSCVARIYLTRYLGVGGTCSGDGEACQLKLQLICHEYSGQAYSTVDKPRRMYQ